MKEIIYCVELLKQRHEFLKKDKEYFYKLQDFEKCAYIRDLEKNIEFVVVKLLKECKTKFDELIKGFEDLKIKYDVLISYFNLDYEKRKARLEFQLEKQKNSLKFMLTIFNFRAANLIREEIKFTEKELKTVNDLILKSL